MFSWGSKFFFGASAASFVSAFIYGLVTGGGLVGVVSMGYKGGVGEHTGYTILIAAGFCLLVTGIANTMVRDGDAEELSALAGSDTIVAVRPPHGISVSPPVVAFGVACLALGIAVSMLFFYLGLAVLFMAAVLWTVQAWADRATGDPATNTVIRQRIVEPFEVPMLSVIMIAVVVVSISRILLTVSKTNSVILASVAAAFVFISAIVITKTKAPRAIVSALVTFGVVTMLVGGVFGAAQGPRDFHGHGDEHSEDHSEQDDHSGEGETSSEGLVSTNEGAGS